MPHTVYLEIYVAFSAMAALPLRSIVAARTLTPTNYGGVLCEEAREVSQCTDFCIHVFKYMGLKRYQSRF